MTPKQAWGIVSIIAILAAAMAVTLLVVAGSDVVLALLFGGAAVLVFFYVLYKRYHVEVVPERDVKLFTNREDLQILCEIYGLDSSGSLFDLRRRLVEFAKGHDDEAFTWVAPRGIISFGSTLVAEGPVPPPEPSVLDQLLRETDEEMVRTRGLVYGSQRKIPRAKPLAACPICEAPAPKAGSICPECGADLLFYDSLSSSKVGKEIVRRKARSASRRLKQVAPPPT